MKGTLQCSRQQADKETITDNALSVEENETARAVKV